MKTISWIVLGIAITFIIYGHWGAFTRSGNNVYDEMGAYIPFFILNAGVILMIAYSLINYNAKEKIIS